MQLNTKHFGAIEVEDSGIIHFNSALPGFPDSKRFALLSDQVQGAENFFYWLQSIDEPAVAFVMVDVVSLMPDYNPLVNREIVEEELGPYDPDCFLVYNIANIKESVEELTVNLQAPIIINDKLKKGFQAICENNEYSVKHYLFK